MPQNDGLSLRAYGRHRRALGLPGGTLAGVKKALQTGRISLAPGGGIDPAIADPMWAARTAPRLKAAVLPDARTRLLASLRSTARGLGFDPDELARLEAGLFDLLYRTSDPGR